MDTLEKDRQIIETILTQRAAIPYTFSDVQREVIFDRSHDSYLLVINGWEGWKRVHGVIVHVDIIDGKFWIQRDGTEEGIATELMEVGIPKERIVLAFRPPSVRPHTEFAVA